MCLYLPSTPGLPYLCLGVKINWDLLATKERRRGREVSGLQTMKYIIIYEYITLILKNFKQGLTM